MIKNVEKVAKCCSPENTPTRCAILIDISLFDTLLRKSRVERCL